MDKPFLSLSIVSEGAQWPENVSMKAKDEVQTDSNGPVGAGVGVWDGDDNPLLVANLTGWKLCLRGEDFITRFHINWKMWNHLLWARLSETLIGIDVDSILALKQKPLLITLWGMWQHSHQMRQRVIALCGDASYHGRINSECTFDHLELVNLIEVLTMLVVLMIMELMWWRDHQKASPPCVWVGSRNRSWCILCGIFTACHPQSVTFCTPFLYAKRIKDCTELNNHQLFNSI